MQKIKRLLITSIIFAALIVLATSTQSQALSIVTDRAVLNGTDFIDWGVLGEADNSVFLSSPQPEDSDASFTVSNLDTDVDEENRGFLRLDQGGDGSGTAYGNFNPGDKLVFTRRAVEIPDDNKYKFSPGPLQVTFDVPVLKAGAQIMDGSYVGDFEARIDAFDNDGQSIGFYTLDGSTNDNQDNSAIFLGVAVEPDDNPIKSIQFTITNVRAVPTQVVINQLDFTPTPLPPSLLLLGSGIMGLGLLGWRRRR